jgi:AmmeMemoRadiSam system protein A
MTKQTVLLAGAILPHPPVIVPGVGSGPMLAGTTVAAMRQLSDELAALQPETVVLISPHAPSFSDYIYCYGGPELSGDLASFGAPQVRLSFGQDQELLDRITTRLGEAGLAAGCLSAEQMRRFQLEQKLDHGALVPLYFLQQAFTFRLVVLSSAGLPISDLYQAGRCLRQAAEDLGRRIILVASGDQSHKAGAASPYGTNPEGARFDQALVTALRQSDLAAVLAIDPALRQRAAECGYRALVMLCGAYAGLGIRSTVLSYEAPYGIGYLVAGLRPDPSLGQVPDALAQAQADNRNHRHTPQNPASAAVVIARDTLSRVLSGNARPTPDDYADLTRQNTWLMDRAGVFVSLKKNGELRGCIGTTAPTTASVAAEIIQNAISAATRDPRFAPVRPDEWDDLAVSVDVLEPSEPVADENDLDPAVYGVIVSSGARSGLLLPNLDGVDTVREQLDIARRKAGIRADEPVRLRRFKVTRYV